MALTDLQRPSSKENLYSNLQNIATNMNALMFRWQNSGDFVENMDAADLSELEITDAAAISDMNDFRTVISEMVGFFYGTSTSQTLVPKTVIDKIRKMM